MISSTKNSSIRNPEVLWGEEGVATSHLNGSKIGKVFKVMIDREEEDFYVGRTEFDSPEVDPEILVSKEKPMRRSGSWFH